MILIINWISWIKAGHNFDLVVVIKIENVEHYFIELNHKVFIPVLITLF